MLNICRRLAILVAGLACVVLLAAPSVIAQETGDSQIFLAGFNAYQQKEYATAVTRLSEVLQKHPDTPLRDMTLFWLARSHYKAGNRQEAARYMAQFSREYPENPLKNTVEEELLALAAQYEKSGQAAVVAKAEAESKAREEAERQRLAAVKAAAEREAAEKAEKARILKAKAEEERKVREEMERQRLAAVKAEQERIAREKVEVERLAVLKADEEKRKAAEKAAAEQLARENTEKQRLALLKTEEERKAAEKATALKAEQERVAREKVEAERIAAQKAEAERVAQEKAKAEQIAAQKAAEERKVAEKAAALKAEQERVAREKVEAERIAAQKAEAARVAKVKAEADAERLVQEKAKAERLAAQKVAEEQKSAQKAAAAQRESEQLAARKAAEAQRAAEKTRAEQRILREKAIAEYKGILERFPGTPAAQTAALRLKELGVAVVVPPTTVASAVAPVPNAQVLSLEVAQYAAFEFAAKSPAVPVNVVSSTTIPFEIVNRGNGPDSFYLASGFPAEFGVRFISTSAQEQAINQTPILQPGDRFNGMMQLQVPAATIDGLRITHPIKAASSFTGEVSQSREITLTASAPLLRAVIKVDKTQPAPGERVQYRVTLLNVGSMAASDVSLRLNFPAQYEPVDGVNAGFRKEMQAALVQDGLQLKSGESREFSATFQVKDEALAREELVVRADLINNPLQSRSTFHGAAVSVQPISAVAVKLASNRVVVIPGQTITIPATVVNNGNQRERFSLVANMPASQKVTIYHDVNRDGLRQPNESEVTVIGPLGPREEAALLLEVATQQNAPDGAEAGISLSAVPESGQDKVALAEARLGFSRPVLQLALKGRSGLLVPGELLTVDLVVHNQGSSLAKGVELQASWPEQLELMASVPSAEGKSVAQGTGWRLGELGAGEKRVVKASFRVRTGTSVGTGIQLKSVLNYFDQLGNRY